MTELGEIVYNVLVLEMKDKQLRVHKILFHSYRELLKTGNAQHVPTESLQ